MTCLKEYLLPGGIQSLYASPSGTLEGTIQFISWPNAGQSNQPAIMDSKLLSERNDTEMIQLHRP